MKTIREIARLHLDKKLSLRVIAASCKLSVSTVQGYAKKINALGLDQATITRLSDRELQEWLRAAPKMSEQ